MTQVNINVNQVTRIEGHGNIVLNTKNGKIEEREIEVGLKGNDFFEVISGLKEGEQIVIGKK